MTETFEHNPGDHEDPVAGATWTVSIVGAILFAVSVLGVAVLYYAVMEDELDRKVLNQPTEEVETLRAEQENRLEAPPRIELRPENPDGEDSVVIPIEHAMQRYLEQQGQGG